LLDFIKRSRFKLPRGAERAREFRLSSRRHITVACKGGKDAFMSKVLAAGFNFLRVGGKAARQTEPPPILCLSLYNADGG
jgi:hypothetical protein